MNFGFRIVGTGFWIPCQWNLDSGFLTTNIFFRITLDVTKLDLSSLKSVLFAVLSRSRALTVLYIKSETRLSSVEALTV